MLNLLSFPFPLPQLGRDSNHRYIPFLLFLYKRSAFLTSEHLAVYTSYDYGSPITEAGLMTPKAYEIKLQGRANLACPASSVENRMTF
jgi:Glycosyl hydrolases family 35